MLVEIDRLKLAQNIADTIVALIDAPHWETSRKEKIRDYALRVKGLCERVEQSLSKENNGSAKQTLAE